MVSRIIFFTLPIFLFSLVLSIWAAPIPLDVDTGHATTLSPRVTHQGRGTYFYPGLGNCGSYSNSDDPIVAISTQIYGGGENCGQWIHITNTDNGQTTFGVVEDSCPSCDPGSLDMSPAVFQNLAQLSVGDIPIEWHYMSREWSP